MENNIKELVNELIGTSVVDVLDMNEWSEKDKIVYQKQMIDTVTNRAIVNIIESLSSEDVEEYKKLEEEDENKGWDYISEKVPNMKEMVAGEYVMVIGELKKELELMKKFDNSLPK